MDPNKIKYIIVPHASAYYSGLCAELAFKEVKNKKVSNIIVLSTDHGLGNEEHSYENIKYLIDKYFKSIPIKVYYVNETYKIENIQKNIQEKTLIIANTDLTHANGRFNTTISNLSELMKIDSQTIKDICERKKTPNIENLCGYYVIECLNQVLTNYKFYPRVVSYYNSQQIHEEFKELDVNESVVSYVSIVFTTKKYNFNNLLSNFEKKLLLKIARTSIEGKSLYFFTPSINLNYGVFVTLYINNELRGCIGTLYNDNTIYTNVVNEAKNSAYHDYRFNSVSKDEIKKLSISITILDKLQKITLSEYLNTNKYKEGQDGIYLKNVAYFLPSVITEQKWTKEEQLIELCKKGRRKDICYKDIELLYNKGYTFKDF